MNYYNEIAQRADDTSIKISLDNGIKIFHTEFEHQTDIINITLGGTPYPEDEYYKALQEVVDYETYYHGHDCFFLVWVTKGHNFEIVEDLPILMSENDLLMITPFTRHHNLYPIGSEVLFIHINPDELLKLLPPSLINNILFSDFFLDFLVDKHVRKSLFFKECMDKIRPIMEKIMDEYLSEQPLSQTQLHFLLGQLIIELARTQGISKSNYSDSEIDEMNDILEFVSENIKTISLEETAKHYGYNSAYLSRKIHEYTGKTYSQLVTNFKLNRALILIKEQRLSVEEIAYEVGYKDISTFYKAFKKHFNCAPREMI